MTKTAKAQTIAKTCIDCSRAMTRKQIDRVRAAGETADNLCLDCIELALWENQHNDDSHETEGAYAPCLICQGQVIQDRSAEVQAKGTARGTIARSARTSHASHDHPMTAKARAACRAAAKA